MTGANGNVIMSGWRDDNPDKGGLPRASAEALRGAEGLHKRINLTSASPHPTITESLPLLSAAPPRRKTGELLARPPAGRAER